MVKDGMLRGGRAERKDRCSRSKAEELCARGLLYAVQCIIDSVRPTRLKVSGSARATMKE